MTPGLRRSLLLLVLAAAIASGLFFGRPFVGSAVAQPADPAPREGGPLPTGRAPVEPLPAPILPGQLPFDRNAPPPPPPDYKNAPAEVGNSLTAYVLVFSPGDHPFYKFGHNAIWIHDVSGRRGVARDKVYNWGTFSFGDPALIPKFFLGRFMYWLSASPIGWTKEAYRAENRGIIAQELDLTAAQKVRLQALVEENLLPENRYYKYDYYRDNCSTRVRDMIDTVTDGGVKAVSKDPARYTYREHTLRLTADLAAEEVILNLVMGDFIDKPVTVWEEGFIPMELQKTLRKVKVPGPDGSEKPLVKREFVLVPTDRPEPAEAPPTWSPWSLALGLLGGLAFAGLGRAARSSAGARVVFGTGLAFSGLVFGFFGCFFLAAWIFTDHVVGYRNENTFLCAPWAIVLTGTGIRVAMNRVKSIVFADKLVRAAAVFAVLGTVLKVIPFFDQKNGFFILFFVPVWLGAAYGTKILREHAEKVVEAAVGKAKEADAGAAAPKKKGKKRKAKATPDVEAAKPEADELDDRGPAGSGDASPEQDRGGDEAAAETNDAVGKAAPAVAGAAKGASEDGDAGEG